MYAVLAPVVVAFVGGDLRHLDFLRPLADGEDEHGRVGEIKRLRDLLGVERRDDQAVVAQLHRLQQHALGGDAEIHVNPLAFGNGRADDDVGRRLGAG